MEQTIMEYYLQGIWSLGMLLLGLGYGKLLKKVREQEAIVQGVQALLRDRIIQSYNHYMDKGYCPIYALENLQLLYEQYCALGGKGTMAELMEKLRKLPTERQVFIV